MNDETNLPIACTLSKSDRARATETYEAGLFRHVTEFRPRKDGASLRFTWDPERIRELAEFLTVETSCCAFMDHAVEFPRGKEEIWLHFTWPDEAREGLMSDLRRILPAGILAADPNPEKVRAREPKSWLARAGVGLTGLGLVSVVCCLAPALGMTALAVGGATLSALVDPLAGASVAVGAGLLTWWKLGRSKTRCSPRC